MHEGSKLSAIAGGQDPVGSVIGAPTGLPMSASQTRAVVSKGANHAQPVAAGAPELPKRIPRRRAQCA
jgi:hypothetical protein